MKGYQKIISLVLSVFVLASMSVVPVFAEDAGLSIVGPDTVLMNYIDNGGIYVPYHIDGLQAGDSIKWNQVTADSGVTVYDPASKAESAFVYNLNNFYTVVNSKKEVKDEALLRLNTSAINLHFQGEALFKPGITMSATVTRGSETYKISKKITVAQVKKTDTLNTAETIHEPIYAKNETADLATWWSGAPNATLEGAEGDKFVRGGTLDKVFSRFLYKVDDNRTKSLQNAFNGIYTVDVCIRQRSDVVAQTNFPIALILQDSGNKSGSTDSNMLKIELSTDSTNTNYEKFKVVGNPSPNPEDPEDVNFSSKDYPKWTTDMYSRKANGEWRWHMVKAVVDGTKRTADVYIDGVLYAEGIRLNPKASKPLKFLQFKGVDVRYVNVYSGYPFERHMDFVEQNKIIYAEQDKTVERTYHMQSRLSDYVYTDKTIAWRSPSTDLIKNLDYAVQDVKVSESNIKKLVEVEEHLNEKKELDLGNIVVKVTPEARTEQFPIRIDRGDNKYTVSSEMLYIKNYNFEGFDGYKVNIDKAPPEFKAYALIQEEAGTKYIDFNRSDTGKLYIDRNPGGVYKMDLEIRDGDSATADASHNTIQVKDSKKLTTNAMFVPESEFTAGTFYFDDANNRYFGTIGNTSISGKLEDLMYLDFGAPLKSLHMKEIEAADMPVAADASLEKSGKSLTVGYDGTDASVTYSQKWYQSADGVNYTEISGQTGKTLQITDGMDGKYIKAGVTAAKGGWTYEYFTQEFLVEALPAGAVKWDYVADTQKLTASIVLESSEFDQAAMMVAVYYDKDNKNIFLESVEATKSDNDDGTFTMTATVDCKKHDTLTATVDYNTADTLTVKAFVWDSMESMRPILKQPAVYTPPVTEA